MRALLASLWIALAVAGTAVPTRAQAVDPGATPAPRSAATLRDREFGVATRQFGLQRRVEMYQWRMGDDGRYRQVWWDRAIDSSGHDARHRNPGEFPLPTRYWIAQDVTLDGAPLDEDVLRRLGSWRGFRPGFTALPGNLSATFQPEGDGLSSAENPLDPQVGDLRVTWREMVLPPLDGRVALHGGRWSLVEGAGSAPAAAAGDAVAHAAQRPRSVLAQMLVYVPLAALMLLVVGFALRVRGQRRRETAARSAR